MPFGVSSKSPPATAYGLLENLMSTASPARGQPDARPDAKHLPTVPSKDQAASLSSLAAIARQADHRESAEAIEVLMNLAALGAVSKPLSERAVEVLTVLHADTKISSSTRAMIRQQAAALCEYTRAALPLAQSKPEGASAIETKAAPQAPARLESFVSASIMEMAAHAVDDKEAQALHEGFAAEAARARPAAGHISLPTATPDMVTSALAGLTEMRVMPTVVTMPPKASAADCNVLDAAVKSLIDLDVDAEVAGQPAVLLLRLTAPNNQPDRWVAMVAARSPHEPGKQDILLLHSLDSQDTFNADLVQTLRHALPMHLATAMAAGCERPRTLPNDGGRFLAHMLRQLNQKLGESPAERVRTSADVKLILDELVHAWGQQPRTTQVQALAALPGVEAASQPANKAEPVVKAPNSTLWWAQS